jgi:hypothetical protein
MPRIGFTPHLQRFRDAPSAFGFAVAHAVRFGSRGEPFAPVVATHRLEPSS